jgi:predicted HTH transcriptional regulator
MKTADLKILVQEGEGTTLEFKEGFSGSLAREIVAMANTIGGRVLLGVRDDGTVAGVKDSNHLRARIQDIARNCDPPVRVLVEPVGEVLVVHVRQSDAKPVQCSEGFFWRQVFNQAYITCLLAKGTDKVHVLDRKDFDGGIVADIENAMRFTERNTRTAWRIEALQRENIPEYPMRALREAITNAVMHRDWFMDGANVFVELYTDRIEVSSPGGLFKGMTLADLGKKSVRRNALIADLLHRIEFIEKAGTGIKRIRDEAHDQGCPEPVFESNLFFTATFRPNPEVRALGGAPGGTSTAHGALRGMSATAS